MKYPSWYTESLKRSKVYGHDLNYVGHEPLFPGPCPGAAEVIAQQKKDKVEKFSFIVSKNE